MDRMTEQFIERFFARWEDFPPDDIREGWERDLAAAFEATIRETSMAAFVVDVERTVEREARQRWEQEIRARLQLSEALLEHLSEVMNGDLNPPDPENDCIWCREIRQEIQRALAIFGEAEPVEDGERHE